MACLAVAAPGARASAQAPSPGTADDRRAEELYLLGDQLYAEGRYEAAITAFQESYRLSGRPLLLFNVANAQERAGRWREAVTSLRAWLEHAPLEEKPAIESRIASLEARIAAREQALAAEARPTSPPEPAPEPEPAHAPAPRVAEPPPEPTARARPSVAGVSLLAGGGAAALAGIGFGIAALHQGSVAERGCVTVDGATVCSREVAGALDRNSAYSIVADVAVALGVAAAAVGLYLVLRPDDDGGPEVTAHVGVGGGAVSLAGRF